MLRSLLVVMALLCALPALAKPPRLTLFITVDALGSEALLRNRSRLKGGMAQLMNQGAYFPSVRLEYAECVTAPGHTTLVSGTYPWRHGINSNKLFNRDTGKRERAFADPDFPVLEVPLNPLEDASPRNLLAETLADRLRLATYGEGKAIAVSGKARSAIPMAGRLGQAWWFHDTVGKFVTGTYYAKEFPSWVKAFNDKKLHETYFGQSWTLLAPAKEYLGQDDRPFETDVYGLGRVFPHPLTGGLPSAGPQFARVVAGTPMMNEVMVQFAKAALENEALGKDDVPDILFVGFSATDHVYHRFGPFSWEFQDALLRLDKVLGELLTAAEKAAGGRANLLVVLSADHGGSAIPEQWATAGLDSARVSVPALRDSFNKELAARFGIPDVILDIEEVDVFLNHKAMVAKKLEFASVRRAVAATIAKHPSFSVAVSRDDLFKTEEGGSLLRSLRLGYHPQRSGDVLAVTRVHHVLAEAPSGASHGTPYSYDSRVPLVLYGKGVRPGLYLQELQAIDVAPTVAALMEMVAPAQTDGTPRAEALAGK